MSSVQIQRIQQEQFSDLFLGKCIAAHSTHRKGQTLCSQKVWTACVTRWSAGRDGGATTVTVRINFVSSHIAMFLLVPPLLLIGRFISDRRKIFSNSSFETTRHVCGKNPRKYSEIHKIHFFQLTFCSNPAIIIFPSI